MRHQVDSLAILLKSIEEKQAKVGIIGLGYVGIPLLLRFAERGFRVTGFDIDEKKIKSLRECKSFISHIPNEKLEKVFQSKLVNYTSDFSEISGIDAIIICVPTPLGEHLEPDISYIISSFESCLPYIKKGQLVSLESTTYPGTTEEEIVSRIEIKGFKTGEDLFVVFSPEREDPGNKSFNTHTIPKVVGGHTPNCLKLGSSLYGQVIDKVVPVSSTKAAELTKLLENIYRAVNIGLVNELKMVSDKLGVNIWEVIDAAATKPFGFTAFYPGPGLGGHCIPIDPFYLTWKAKEYGLHTHFIELAGQINRSMPSWVVKKVIYALNDQCKSVKKSRILIIGVSYKKNIDDYRESPAIEIMKELEKIGAIVDYHDSYVPLLDDQHVYHGKKQSVELSSASIQAYDAILLTTDHDKLNYDLILESASLIVDTRNRFKATSPKVYKA